MNLKDNKVWIVKGNNCFTVFSSKAYAEEYKKSFIETWEKSIIRETVPKSLNDLGEIEKHGKDYPDVISVNKDHFELYKKWERGGTYSKQTWRYELMSNMDWDNYYEDFVTDFVIEEHIVCK